MTRILQISDTHIVSPGERAYGVVDTAAALRNMITTIERHAPHWGQIDLVLVTGDLTDHGQPEQYREFLRLVEPLSIPLVAIPGNHDDRDAMRSAFSSFDWMPKDGPLNLRVDLRDVSVLALDTNVAGAPFGTLSATTLQWLRTQLEELAPKPILIGMHHPPIETGIALMDVQRLTNSADLAPLISEYDGICKIVAGHVHRMISGTLADIPVTLCPGTSHAVTLDLRDTPNNTFCLEPPGALLHEFGARTVTHLIASEPFEGPFPFG